MCMHVVWCMCVCVRVRREARARGQSLVSTHQGCCPLFSNGLLLAWNSPNRSGSLASESQRSTCLCFPPLGFQEHVMMLGFHSNHRSLCVGGHTLPSEASPSPIILIHILVNSLHSNYCHISTISINQH